MAATGAERLHGLDSLRALAMLLGIVLHGALAYVVMPFPWPVHDATRHFAFDALVGFIHGFRMQVFFLLAGFFAHLVLQRLGPRGFARQRLQRIGLPFLAGMLVIVPLVGLLWWQGDPGFVEARHAGAGRGPLAYPTVHLWFLQMLLILYAGALALLACHRWPGAMRLLGRIDAAFDALIRSRSKPLLLAVPTVALLWLGPRVPEIQMAGMGLLPPWQAIAYYALFFGVGWWLHRRQHLLADLAQSLPLYFAIAVASFVVLGAALGAIDRQLPVSYTTLKAVALVAAALQAWCMTFALTGLFLRFGAADRPWVRYVADASYWWYLWHLPLVIALQLLVANWPLPGALKLLVVLGGTVAVLLPSYHWMVRYTWIGRIMNGPRERPAAHAAASDTHAAPGALS